MRSVLDPDPAENIEILVRDPAGSATSPPRTQKGGPKILKPRDFSESRDFIATEFLYTFFLLNPGLWSLRHHSNAAPAPEPFSFSRLRLLLIRYNFTLIKLMLFFVILIAPRFFTHLPAWVSYIKIDNVL